MLSDQIKSTEILDLTPFNSLLIFETYVLAFVITLLVLLDPIGIIACFLDGYIEFGSGFLAQLIYDLVNFRDFIKRKL